MKMIVRDIMTPDVCTAAPETTVGEIAQRLAGLRISGLPVIDPENQVVGIVTESDLLRRPEIGTEPKRGRWTQLFSSTDELARDFVKMRARRAADIMTRDVICVGEDDDAADVADLFDRRGIKRVPVLRHGKLVGIVSRMDLVRALSRATIDEGMTISSKEDDVAVSTRFRKTLQAEPWANLGYLNFAVTDGTLELWGLVASADVKRALRVAAENTPGVRRVEDHLTTDRYIAA